MILFTSRCEQQFVHIWCEHQMWTKLDLFTFKCEHIVNLFTFKCEQIQFCSHLCTHLNVNTAFKSCSHLNVNTVTKSTKNSSIWISSETELSTAAVVIVKLGEDQADKTSLISRRGRSKPRAVLSVSSSVLASRCPICTFWRTSARFRTRTTLVEVCLANHFIVLSVLERILTFDPHGIIFQSTHFRRTCLWAVAGDGTPCCQRLGFEYF